MEISWTFHCEYMEKNWGFNRLKWGYHGDIGNDEVGFDEPNLIRVEVRNALKAFLVVSRSQGFEHTNEDQQWTYTLKEPLLNCGNIAILMVN